MAAWYAGNTFYNVYNKKATNMIHAHWFVAAAQLVVGIVWSLSCWTLGIRKKPNLTGADIAKCIPGKFLGVDFVRLVFGGLSTWFLTTFVLFLSWFM